LAHEEGDPVLGADDDLLQIAETLDEPQSANNGPGAIRFDHIAPDVAIAPHHGIDHGGEWDAEGAQAVRVYLNLILPDDPPDTRHLSDAGHGVQLITDEPVLERPQVLERVALPLDGVPEDVTHTGCIGAKCRHGARGQGLPDQV
jgi:hypothetical protein